MERLFQSLMLKIKLPLRKVSTNYFLTPRIKKEIENWAINNYTLLKQKGRFTAELGEVSKAEKA